MKIYSINQSQYDVQPSGFQTFSGYSPFSHAYPLAYLENVRHGLGVFTLVVCEARDISKFGLFSLGENEA